MVKDAGLVGISIQPVGPVCAVVVETHGKGLRYQDGFHIQTAAYG